MATNHTTADDDTHWHPATIQRRLPRRNELTDEQQEALAVAVRNPDAGIGSITDEAGSQLRVLANVLWKLKVGGYDDAAVDHDPVLNDGSKQFLDRTLKQRASIHWNAKHPNGFDVMTYEQAGEHCAAELGVSMHWSTLYNQKKKWPALVDERRKWLGDDGIERLSEDDAPGESLGKGGEEPLRPKLKRAGITDLPPHNLDGLPTLSERRSEAARASNRKTDRTGENPDSAETGADEGSGGGSSTPEPGGKSAETTTAEPADTTERQVGNVSYKGPSSGLDLAGDHAPKLLVDRADSAADVDVAEELARIRAEDGDFGENAYEREVSIGDRDELEAEVRRLRMLVASQGQMLTALRDTLEGLSVSVELTAETPEGDDGE